MNGYKMTADSYRKFLETDPNIDRESTQKKIRVYDFLSSCDDGEIMELFDSTAFNDVVKGYLQMALDNLEVEAETRQAILNERRYLFDTVTAGQAKEYYITH